MMDSQNMINNERKTSEKRNCKKDEMNLFIIHKIRF